MSKDLIQTLKHQHEEGLGKLNELEDAVVNLEDKGLNPEDISSVRSAVSFINTEIRQHNQHEEDVLFPELEKHIPQQGPTSVMRSEHRELWNKLDELEANIKAIEGAGGKNDNGVLETLMETARDIISLLRNHIAKENNILYPLALNILSQDQIDNINSTL
ncbi:MAG: hemerythrin domain-containing protein [Actinobacteria bacterium]|nr:hemerythrin domain-containing protein [Actinomycetota bacterium]